MKTPVLSALATLGLLLHAQVAPDNTAWPRSYTVEGTEVILYEPRIEQWQGSSLEAVFAVGLKEKDDEQPVYGSFKVHAETVTNSDTRTVTIFNATAGDFQLPDAPDKLAALTRSVTALSPDKPLKVPLDELLAGVPSSDIVTKDTVTTATRNDAPRMIVSYGNTLLLAFDGKPVFQAIPGTGLEAAVNTPATLLRPEGAGSPLSLLTNDGAWLTAEKLDGKWEKNDAPPPGFDRIPPEHPVGRAIKNVWPPVSPVLSVPEVVTSDSPAELIQLDGSPKYDRIGDLPLVRVGNTETPLFYHFDQSAFYVLISGRWFAAAELKGPWTYVPHDQLPPEFAQIPPGDPSGDVRVSVAGTREAEEATKEAQIPTVARVLVRDAPKLVVDYDGDPIYDEIPGTELAYGVNTTHEVVRYGGRYYCCRDGVWFMADGPYGRPWEICRSLPRAIFGIPTSNPLYHLRFCDIDGYADDWVDYRCTAGYRGTYVDPYSRVCVYGTGWRYPSYSSPNYYCGSLWTYGFGSSYRRNYGFEWRSRHVAHTSWFPERNRSRHDYSARRADCGRFGGRWNGSDQWRSAPSRTTPYSDWDQRRVTVRGDAFASAAHQRHDGGTPSKLRVTSLRQTNPVFEKEVRSGQRGELYRRTSGGWQHRDSGQWKDPDKNHAIDARAPGIASRQDRGEKDHRVARKDEHPVIRRSGDGPGRGTPSTLPKGGAPHESARGRDGKPPGNADPSVARRDFEIRSALPAQEDRSKKSPGLPKVDSRADRSLPIGDNPPKKSPGLPRYDSRADRSLPIQDNPPKLRRDNSEPDKGRAPDWNSPSRIHRETTPEPKHIERRDTSQPQAQVHREAPRHVEQPKAPPQARIAPPQPKHSSPPPQAQVQREAPRHFEQPKPQPQARIAPPQPKHSSPPPQAQVQREAPRHFEQPKPQPQARIAPPQPKHSSPPPQARSAPPQPRPEPGSSGRDPKSHRSNDKKR